MKIEVSEVNVGDFLRLDDVQSPVQVEILNEGEVAEFADNQGKVKKRYRFKVKLPDGTEKIWTMNLTTLKNLKEKWGDETKNWVGKHVLVIKTKISKYDALLGTPVD